jgi:alpha-L-fucosidase
LQPGAGGYRRADDAHHRTADEVIALLDAAAAQNGNLLLNTGPLPDGSIHPEDVATLRELGRRTKQ